MLYTLLTKSEISAIEKILKSHSIKYEVLVDEELIARQNEEHKYVADRHGQVRRTTAIYNLIIEKKSLIGSRFSLRPSSRDSISFPRCRTSPSRAIAMK